MGSIVSKIRKWLPFGKVDEISVEELNHLIENNPKQIQLLDVRTKAEWKSGHISGAINIPITELVSRLDELSFNKEVLLVPICLSAHRSIPAVRIFKELGYKDVKQLSGGMKSWNKYTKAKLLPKN